MAGSLSTVEHVLINFQTQGFDTAAGYMKDLSRALDKNLDVVNRSQAQWSVASKTLMGLGMIAAAAGVKIVSLGADIQRARATMEIFTGSVSKANVHLKELQRFTLTTPFRLQQVMQASLTMQAYGTKVNEVNRYLKAMGDIASATGSELQYVVDALNQINVGNVGVGLATLRGFGVPTTAIQAKALNAGWTGDVYDMPSTMAKKFLLQFSQEKFGGTMEKQMGTLHGQLSNLGDAVQRLGMTLGEGEANALVPFIESVQGAVNALNKLGTGGSSTFVRGLLQGGLSLVVAGWTAKLREGILVQRLLTEAELRRASATDKATAAELRKAGIASSGNMGTTLTKGSFAMTAAATFAGMEMMSSGAAIGSRRANTASEEAELFSLTQEKANLEAEGVRTQTDNTEAIDSLTNKIGELKEAISAKKGASSATGGAIGAAAGAAIGLGLMSGNPLAMAASGIVAAGISGFNYLEATKDSALRDTREAFLKDVRSGKRSADNVRLAWEWGAEQNERKAKYPEMLAGGYYTAAKLQREEIARLDAGGINELRVQERAGEVDRIIGEKMKSISHLSQEEQDRLLSQFIQKEMNSPDDRYWTQNPELRTNNSQGVMNSTYWKAGLDAEARTVMRNQTLIQEIENAKTLASAGISFGNLGIKIPSGLFGSNAVKYGITSLGQTGTGPAAALELEKVTFNAYKAQYDMLAETLSNGANQDIPQVRMQMQNLLKTMTQSAIAIREMTDQVALLNIATAGLDIMQGRALLGPQLARPEGQQLGFELYSGRMAKIEEYNIGEAMLNRQKAAVLRGKANRFLPGTDEYNQIMQESYELELRANQQLYDSKLSIYQLDEARLEAQMKQGLSVESELASTSQLYDKYKKIASDKNSTQEEREAAINMMDLLRGKYLESELASTRQLYNKYEQIANDKNSTQAERYAAINMMDRLRGKYLESADQHYFNYTPGMKQTMGEREVANFSPYGASNYLTAQMQQAITDMKLRTSEARLSWGLSVGKIRLGSQEELQLQQEITRNTEELARLRYTIAQEGIAREQAAIGLREANLRNTMAGYEYEQTQALGFGGYRGEYRSALAGIRGKQYSALESASIAQDTIVTLNKSLDLALQRSGGDEGDKEVLDLRSKIVDQETKLVQSQNEMLQTRKETFDAEYARMQGELGILGGRKGVISARADALTGGIGLGNWVARQQLIPMAIMAASQAFANAKELRKYGPDAEEKYLEQERIGWENMAEVRRLRNPLAELAGAVFGGPSSASGFIQPLIARIGSARLMGSEEGRKIVIEMRLTGAEEAFDNTEHRSEMVGQLLADLLCTSPVISKRM